MNKSIQGEIVSESEVAADLGFADVFEMRRWQTEMGHKVADLEHELRQAINERDRFRWNLRRTIVVLEKIIEADPPLSDDLKLGMSVVIGRGVDWDHRLKDWFNT